MKLVFCQVHDLEFGEFTVYLTIGKPQTAARDLDRKDGTCIAKVYEEERQS